MKNEKINKLLITLKESDWYKSLSNASTVYLVGGCVRDSLLDRETKDIDLVVEGISINEIKDILSDFGYVDMVGESFSVIKFTPYNFKGEPFDIAVPRSDVKVDKGHKGFEVITENISIEEDLKRRDFTINSIAVEIDTGKLIDPFKGHEDIYDRILRATNKRAFIEDPLRILRGIQFSSRFLLNVEEETMNLMKENSSLIKEIAPERIYGEFIKIIRKKGNIYRALQLLRKTEIDKALGMFIAINTLPDDIDDEYSFFYILGAMSDEHPAVFVKKAFKVPNNIEKGVTGMYNISYNIDYGVKDEEVFKFLIFKEFSKAPFLLDNTFFSPRVKKVAKMIKNGEIPKTVNDIKIDGDDIMNFFDLTPCPSVGEIMQTVIKDAVNNKFDWNDRVSCLKYLQNLNK